MLFDTHAHLDQEEFDADRQAVVRRAHDAGVTRIVAVGTTAPTSQRCVELAHQFAGVLAAVGIQPNYTAQVEVGDWDRVVTAADDPRVVAIGETGLDRHWDYAPFAVQQDFFDRHLRLSQIRGLPFIVHTRESDADVVAMLREARTRGPLSGVMHSFTGSAETAAECVELGLFISFAGMVTFKKSDALRAVAATVPAERIVIETDSPYLAPHPLRGKQNEPANLVHTARVLAEVRGQSLDELSRLTTANACRLFGVAGN
ncbi:MAG TPA: TatD family hydrolase [Pirellulales bacterium]|jgi:TatD DNase family protein|nr:TatD family hydrolase [Pirellulales bacterium]